MFRKTENFDDGFRFEYIVYQTDLGAPTQVGSSSLTEAEAKMRDTLPFNIEAPTLLDIEDPNAVILRKAQEVSQYYRPKVEEMPAE